MAGYYRMLILSEKDGYLIWPKGDKPDDWPFFFGRLSSFTRLPDQVDVPSVGYDAIEIQGDVVGTQQFWAIDGTATLHFGKETQTVRVHLNKPPPAIDYAQRLERLARRAEQLIAEEQKPGPKGSREQAIQVLRDQEMIVDGKNSVVSAEWSEHLRQWFVKIQNVDGTTFSCYVNVQMRNVLFELP